MRFNRSQDVTGIPPQTPEALGLEPKGGNVHGGPAQPPEEHDSTPSQPLPGKPGVPAPPIGEGADTLPLNAIGDVPPPPIPAPPTPRAPIITGPGIAGIRGTEAGTLCASWYPWRLSLPPRLQSPPTASLRSWRPGRWWHRRRERTRR
jgi:hypothetical protein